MADAYVFLNWARYGLLSGTVTPDTTTPVRADVSVTLRLTTHTADGSTITDDMATPLRVIGPGDVIGIDPRIVVRTTPVHQTPDFPPNLMASVEFARPDFPWLFTPAGPVNDQLMPWLTLAVVRKDLATISVDPSRPLPMLACPVTELPDLHEARFWAHAHVTGDPTKPLDLSNTARSVSRLICARHLDPPPGGAQSPGYYACLVPTYDVGRKAGLGLEIDAADEQVARPAWDVSIASATAQLPVYYQWEFSTGPLGDFQDLVNHLQFLANPPAVPPRIMDVSQPGPGLGSYPSGRLGIGSVLQPVDTPRVDWPAEAPVPFSTLQNDIRSVLQTPPDVGSGITPPLYGQPQAAQTVQALLAPGAVPPWPGELNVHAGRRVAAAIGARIVQLQQEQLVADAWSQAGELQAANQLLRQKQLGREVSSSVYDKRLLTASSPTQQQITAPLIVPQSPPPPGGAPVTIAPVQPRPTPPNPTVDAVLSAPFRRITRPLGPLGHAATHGTLSIAAPVRPVSPVAPVAPVVTSVAGAIGQLLGAITSGQTGGLHLAPPQSGSSVAVSASGVSLAAPQPAAPTLFQAMAIAPSTTTPSGVLAQVDPRQTFVQEAQNRLDLPTPLQTMWSRPEPLAPVTLVPNFPQPMYEPLRDQFSDMFLPGLDSIPNNSVLLLQSDGQFIESFLVGLNDEMSRVLLWREFPTDLSGTYFRQFWDVRSQTTQSSNPASLYDIEPINSWTQHLGANLRPGRGDGLLMLLFKGDLLHRFPNTLIYAAPAVWSTSAGQPVWPPKVDDAAPVKLPVLRVDAAPQITLVGFDIPGGATAALGTPTPPGTPGWFFILEEHPTEPRFGLEISKSTLTTWHALAWPDVTTRTDGSAYIDVGHSHPALVPLPAGTPAADPADSGVTWGAGSAAMAYIVLKKAFRMEVHADCWLPRT
jgi:hypothetical protein